MNDTAPSLIDALETALLDATHRIRPDVLLLSGGVDSSLLAAMWRHHGHAFRAITVVRHPSWVCGVHPPDLRLPCGTDGTAAATVADGLDLDWLLAKLDQRVALDRLDDTIRLSGSFDLGQLNNVPLVAGLRHAQGQTIATGDDGDGLFCGYRYLQNIPDWGAYVRHRLPAIDPPVRALATVSGCTPCFPYLDPAVAGIAARLNRDDVLRSARLGDTPSFMDQFDAADHLWGKVALRRVAERWLPHEVAWRPKMDLEFGSGMCALETPLAASVDGPARERLDATGIRWLNDAHRGMYLRFRTLGLEIPPPIEGEYTCVSCGGGVPDGTRHCPTCGAWPSDM